MTRRKRQSLPEGDDGHTIVSMNVEGMPWYRPTAAPPDGMGAPHASRHEEPERKSGQTADRLTREENWFFTWGALKAALLVVGVMCVGIVLFILFCQFVWFR